jgi:hypothetical protein
METKQTAVEFLESQYNYNDKLTAVDFEQAKKMFEKQIIDAYNENENYMCDGTEGKQYYNETFKKEKGL